MGTDPVELLPKYRHRWNSSKLGEGPTFDKQYWIVSMESALWHQVGKEVLMTWNMNHQVMGIQSTLEHVKPKDWPLIRHRINIALQLGYEEV